MWVARGLLLVLCTLVIARSAPARVEGMRWRAPEPSGEGAQSFRIYYGTRTRDYAHVIDLGNPPPGPDGVRSHDLVVPDADPIYVAMTSYDEGGESGYSNEVFRDGIRLPRLLDVTAAAGLADPEDGGEAPPQELPVDMAGGAAAGDYDGDGWVDLYVTRWGRADRLFRNRGDGTFEDRTLAAGLGTLLPSTGAGWGDVDNDGDLDLYVTTAGPGALRFHLYLNDGAGRFEEDAVARGAAVLGPEVRYGQSVAFGDFDLDGWLDLHTTEWWPGDAGAAPGSSSARLLRNRGAAAPGFFEDVTEAAPRVLRRCPRGSRTSMGTGRPTCSWSAMAGPVGCSGTKAGRRSSTVPRARGSERTRTARAARSETSTETGSSIGSSPGSIILATRAPSPARRARLGPRATVCTAGSESGASWT